MRRQLCKVSRLPPALAERFALEPADHPHDIYRRGSEQVLEVRTRQAAVATLAHSKAPDALREAALDARPQRLLGFEGGGFLPLARRLERLMVRLRPDRELPWGVFRRGAHWTGGTGAIGGAVKPAWSKYSNVSFHRNLHPSLLGSAPQVMQSFVRNHGFMPTFGDV